MEIGEPRGYRVNILLLLFAILGWSPEMDYWHWSYVPAQPYTRETRTSIGCPQGWAVSMRTWMVPYHQHTIGRASYYDPGLMRDQVVYRGVESDIYFDGVALMTPANMLDRVYLKPPHTGKWEGPYIAVDASASHHFCSNVYQLHLAVEVGWDTWKRWGRERGSLPYDNVEVYIGNQFPDDGKLLPAQTYWPQLIWKGEK